MNQTTIVALSLVFLVSIPVLLNGHEADFIHREVRQARPSSQQAAGIARSRVAFLKPMQAGAGFTIPRISGITISGKISASVSLQGVLSSDIEDCMDKLARKSSKQVRAFYLQERRSLKRRAGSSYFMFFQAAANYGYSQSRATKAFLKRKDFLSFANSAQKLLQEVKPRQLDSTFTARFSIKTTGQATSLFAYMVVNALTMKSGKVLYVVRDRPVVVIADNMSNIADKTPKMGRKFSWRGATKGKKNPIC